MRYLSIVLLTLFPSGVAANQSLTPRPLDSLASQALARSLEASATTRALVRRLESSNVIVHIETSRSLPLGIGGTTRFVVSRGGFRYLRITIATELPDRARAAILAHELQHACEIADSAADDVKGLKRVFEQHGHRSGEFFETAAAIATERSVRLEMRTPRVLQAEPVVKFHH